jgi:hypothetical protein
MMTRMDAERKNNLERKAAGIRGEPSQPAFLARLAETRVTQAQQPSASGG